MFTIFMLLLLFMGYQLKNTEALATKSSFEDINPSYLNNTKAALKKNDNRLIQYQVTPVSLAAAQKNLQIILLSNQTEFSNDMSIITYTF